MTGAMPRSTSGMAPVTDAPFGMGHSPSVLPPGVCSGVSCWTMYDPELAEAGDSEIVTAAAEPNRHRASDEPTIRARVEKFRLRCIPYLLIALLAKTGCPAVAQVSQPKRSANRIRAGRPITSDKAGRLVADTGQASDNVECCFAVLIARYL